MLTQLTLDQLRILASIVDEGSFSAAGRRLGRVQSAISHAVRNLEEANGVTLFDRSSRRPELTAEDLGLQNPRDPKKLPDAENVAFVHIPPEGIDLQLAQQAFEKLYIDQAYQMANGNESQAAKLLNINHHTFRYRRKKLLNIE